MANNSSISISFIRSWLRNTRLMQKSNGYKFSSHGKGSSTTLQSTSLARTFKVSVKDHSQSRIRLYLSSTAFWTAQSSIERQVYITGSCLRTHIFHGTNFTRKQYLYRITQISCIDADTKLVFGPLYEDGARHLFGNSPSGFSYSSL